MKKFVVAGAVAGLLAMTAAGYAADTEKMYLGMQGDKHMVMGGMSSEGSELLMGENGMKPGTCPAGQYYTTDSSQQMVMACDTDAQYMLTPPASGEMMVDGQPYPEGTMMMTPAQ